MMNLISQIIGYGTITGVTLAVALAAIFCAGLALSYPRYIVLGVVAILMLFPESSSYGTLEGEAASLIYVKGTKTFFFSFLDMVLFGTWLLVVPFGRLWQRTRDAVLPMSKCYVAFAVLFLGHVVVGLFDSRHPSLLDFGGRGVIGVLWQGMFFSLLVTVIRTERDLQLLLRLMLATLACREFYGFGRYLFLGGDPQNAYANLQNIRIKLTFWDINDSILASFMVGYCAWRLFADRVAGSSRLLLGGCAVLAALIPLLSARRTAQGGVLLALLVLLFLLPKGRRGLVLLAVTLMVPAAIVVTAARSEGRGSMIEKILIDVKLTGDRFADPRRSRFHELKTAWESIREQPVFGLGPTGSFTPSSQIGLEYHRGRYDFVHSGFGHILLKTGFVGLAIYSALFWFYLAFLRREWRRMPETRKAMAVGSICAMGATLPTILFGTPIGEIRTMLVTALLLAIPFVVSRLEASAIALPARAPDLPPLSSTASRSYISG